MASQQDISYIASQLEMSSQEYPDDVPSVQRVFATSLQRNFHEFFCPNVVERYIVCIEWVEFDRILKIHSYEKNFLFLLGLIYKFASEWVNRKA